MILHLSTCQLWLSETELGYMEPISYVEAVNLIYQEAGINPLTLPESRTENVMEIVLDRLPNRSSDSEFYNHCKHYLRDLGGKFIYKLIPSENCTNISGFISIMNRFR